MKHLAACIITLILSFVGLSVKAQNSTSTQIEIENLSAKVKKLEHELSYLNLSYKLGILNNQINVATSDVNIKALEMQVYVFHNDLMTSQAQSYHTILKEWYQAALDNKHSTEYLYKMTKLLVSSSTEEFTEDENNLLTQQCDVIEKAFGSFDVSLNFVEKLLEGWGNHY